MTTERLELREFTYELAEQIVAGEREDTWAADYPTGGDVVVAQHVLRAQLRGEWVPYQLVLRESGTVIGGAGYHGPPNVEGTVEVGYGVAVSHQGRGYATEATRALVERAIELGAHRVVAHTDGSNAASRQVLENLGFALVRAEPQVEDGYYYMLTF
ncbi:GNAT family N-acetyltransferase [Allocatelliglobosispora scoriae]|nr:GNAT family N-acetyltransferase [Allocatelliglobosispora scoriae]